MQQTKQKNLPCIFVAFDMNDQARARKLLSQLDGVSCGIKIGKEMFTTFGPAWVEEVVHQGFPVFLDLKYHDIPNTVARACVAAAGLGVQLVNLHASGGLAMMQAAQEALNNLNTPPALIAVTVLTSLLDKDLQEIGYQYPTATLVQRLAQLTQKAGLSGVVCSAEEAKALRSLCGPDFKLVTPGIRLESQDAHDQKRVLTPEAAMAAGSDHLVIGRSITQASDPATMVAQILDRIQKA